MIPKGAGQCYSLGLALLGAALLSPAHAQAPCHSQTPLEATYCAIVAAGGEQELPSFASFRQNPPATQHLLLHRLAQKYKIPLTPPPKIAAKAPASTEPAAPAPRAPPRRPAAPLTPSSAPAPSNSPAALAGLALSGCQLAGEAIQCGAQRFVLETNRPNSQLAAGALSPSNRLIFPARSPQQDLNHYLSQCYSQYLHKMLAIGLGAATLTFGKFSGIYEEVSRQKVDFSARFDTMYRFLQKDKQQQATPKRFTQALPSQLQQCTGLSAQLIVCDNGQTNWIYRL